MENIWVGRLFLLLLGLSLVLGGLATLVEGRVNYRNYWGGLVFAPFGIALGSAVLVVLTMRWNTLNQRDRPTKLTGRAARLARKADQTKFPIDTFRKW
jgi:hypothetical protein